MQRIWKNAPEVNVSPEIVAACGGDMLVASILFRRGYTTAEQVRGFLDLEAYQPASPYCFTDMTRAVGRILQAAETGEKVLIWGDFDADGQTSTTILFEAFHAIGTNVQYHIPLREGEGHGIREKPLQKYIADGISLIVTCDTGISEHKSIRLAQEHGVDVIITDHHELPETLPDEAIAILNPRMLPPGHPLGTLPGCGVAYLLAQAVLLAAGKPELAEKGLDLAAIGIVADVAELKGDARYLLQRGLQALRRNERPGLACLYQLNDLDAGTITEEHLGFYVAPRLNALGRLADASLAVEFFSTHDQAKAQYLAQILEDLNARRKVLTDQVLQGALSQVEQHPTWESDSILVLAHPEWPGGVLGIVANALVSRYQKPAILFQIGKDGLARGSARSVNGIHITRAIGAHREMLFSFGGHPGAAGLSLPADQVDAFRQVMQVTVAKMATEAPLASELTVDAEIYLSDTSLELAKRLNILSPFGQGNPAPVFSSPLVKIVESIPVGKLKDHLSIQIQDPSRTMSSIWWQGAGQTLPEDWFQLAYTLRATTFQGKEQLQIEWIDWTEGAPGTAIPSVQPGEEWIDWHGIPDWLARLAELREQYKDICVFAEGELKSLVNGVDRNELTPASVLVWVSLPPGPLEREQILNKVNPRKQVVIGAAPIEQETTAFLRRLLGVTRFLVEKNHGQVSLARLASATSERVSSVRFGLDYLAARGELVPRESDGQTVNIQFEKTAPTKDVAQILKKLERNLEESKSYRAGLLQNEDVWK